MVSFFWPFTLAENGIIMILSTRIHRKMYFVYRCHCMAAGNESNILLYKAGYSGFTRLFIMLQNLYIFVKLC